MSTARGESLPRRVADAFRAELGDLRGRVHGPDLELRRGLSVRVGLVIAALAFGYYLWMGAGVAAGRYLDQYNLAFDYDPSRYVLLWTGERSEWDEETNGAEYQVRHPFLLAVRPVLRALLGTGIEPKLLCTVFVAGCGAFAVLCAFLFLRIHGVRVAESALLTSLFAGSATQLAHSTIVEGYGPTAATLALVYLLARLRFRFPGTWAKTRFLALVAGFGVTSTTLVPALIAEVGTWRSKLAWVDALIRASVFGVLAAGVLFVTAWAGGALRLEGEGFQPIEILKTARYAGHFEDELPPVGLLGIAKTFVAFGFVAPRFTEVSVTEGEQAGVMLDFRRFDYPPWAGAAAVAWLALTGLGLVFSLVRSETRWFGFVLVLGILFHFALYTRYQFRQSLFLGSTLPHFTIFALQAELFRVVGGLPRGGRKIVLGAAGVLVGAIVWNNHLRFSELVRTFAS